MRLYEEQKDINDKFVEHDYHGVGLIESNGESWHEVDKDDRCPCNYNTIGVEDGEVVP